MKETKGTLHPLTLVISDAMRIFASMGFEIATGPEMESEKYNFDMMNFPKDHPARDMQDTYFIKNHPGMIMRTHTSNVQARYMEEKSQAGIMPPYAIVVPGKVFRNEATDATHEAQFHQIEGLFVAEKASLANLKAILLEFFKEFAGPEADIRLRPSFFPFVEPGAEVDVKMTMKDGSTKWVEVLGAGVVHPEVLKNAGIDPEKYAGIAFGMGVERLAMLKFGVTDIRFFFQGDLRLNQF